MPSNFGSLRLSPGLQKTAKCGVCGAKMKVNRNVLGPTSSVEAMCGGKHLHDWFECHNSGEEWHERAVALFEEWEETESRQIRKILKKEISQILKTKKIPK